MYPPIKKAITAGGYVEVTLPTSHGCSSYSIWTEDGAAFYVASSSAGTDGVLVTTDGTAGLPISVNATLRPGGTVCYAKGTTSTNLVGLITKV